MEKTREQQMLASAVNEIKGLRRRNELMAARLETFDKCMLMLHTQLPHQGQGMSPDLVWEIEKYLSTPAEEEAK